MAFIIDDIAKAVGSIADIAGRFIPDPKQKAEFENQLMSNLQAWDRGQVEINIAEAQTQSIYLAGWRPLVGWIGAVAFGYHVILLPIIVAVCKTNGYELELPEFNQDLLEFTLYGMLGIGGMRTFEKFKKITK